MSRTITLAVAAASALLIARRPRRLLAEPRPIAHASGDPVTVIPSLIQTRITRVDNAIERLTDYVDDGDTAGVDRTGKVIRRQLAAAWRGAAYYVKNPPPPVAEDAQEADDAPIVADPPTAAFAVLESYHAVAASIGQLTDGARVPVLNSMSTTLFWRWTRVTRRSPRSARSIRPSIPRAKSPRARPRVRDRDARDRPALRRRDPAAQGPPGRRQGPAPRRRAILRLALAQTLLSQNTVNSAWPPVIED